MTMPYNRPNLPYISGDLPNNTRFTDITNSSPDNAVSAQVFDTDVNSAFDSINALATVVDGIGAGILPGADNPLNINKLPTTDGNPEPTISFIFINDNNIQPGGISGISIATNSITTNNLQNGCISNSKVVDQAINQQKLGLLSVGTPQLQLLSVNDPIIANMNGSKIIAGTMPASAIINGSLTSTQISPSVGATKIQQQIATATNVYATPATQQFHPSAASFWCVFDGTRAGTNAPLAGFNVTSITRGGSPGLYAINYTIPFSTVNYCVVITATPTGGNYLFGQINSLTLSTANIIIATSNTVSQTDSNLISVVGFGAQ